MSQYLLPTGKDRERIRDNFVKFIDGLDAKFVWEIEVTRFAKPRSDPQNSALWGVAYKSLRTQTGNDTDDLHQFFCGEYFGWKEFVVMGRKKVKPLRTTTHDENGNRSVMPMTDFAEFYTFIQSRAAQNGYMIPDPDPLWFRQDAAA